MGIESRLHDPLDDLLAGHILRVRLAGDDELHGSIGIGQDPRGSADVAEEEIAAFVRREAAREAQGEDLGRPSVQRLTRAPGVLSAGRGELVEATADLLDQRDLELPAHGH